MVPVFSLPTTFLILYVAIAGRYYLFARGFDAYCRWRHADGARQIAPGTTRASEELRRSLVACLFFAAAGTALIVAFHRGATRIYFEAGKFGLLWLPLSFALLALLHETYFYWTHRWLHRPRWFPLHAAHHRSRPPTAYAAFSFSPAEAAIQAAILPVLVLLVPVHIGVLGLFLLFMAVLGTVNHLGYELYPAGFARHPWFRWWISATHHQMHHEKLHGNFGLYFSLWDRWLGTELPGYEERFAGITSPRADYDLILVGGGLSGGLAAFRLAQARPELRVLLLERERRLGGNHTWSFHASDIPGKSHEWIAPLVSRRWSRQEFRFPSYTRVIEEPYCSIRSEHFHARLSECVNTRQAEAVELGPRSVTLADGTVLSAHLVLDARGTPPASGPAQEFLGLELELEHPHGLEHPVIMDARVPQQGGFRFFYLLPWDEKRILVEDTRYVDRAGSALSWEKEILAYAEAQGWRVARVLRRERGALDIPLRSGTRPPLSIGARGSLFHDTTGYSLADSVRVAELLAAQKDIRRAGAALKAYSRSRAPARIFFRALNRMLFLAARPGERYRVLERFHRLPAPTIARFYSGRPTWIDRARILLGKPPVPVGRALRALVGGES